jgi:O-antigen/teichoic acid export membrane protein
MYIFHSIFWKYLERTGAQGVSFIVSIILARLLNPADFGALALVMVFIAVAGVFVSSGLNTALVQKKNSDHLDFSTVFWMSGIIALFVYSILFFAAPTIAEFYDNISLVPVVRVLGISLFLGSLNSVQEAYVQKHFQFKKLFYRSIGAVIPSGVLGIVLAYQNFGLWALVAQQLTNQALMGIIMLAAVEWKPKFEFSFARGKELFKFSYKLLLSGLLDSAYTNLYNLIIGKTFSPTELGYYNRGEKFPNMIVSNVNTSITSVMLPAMSQHQDDKPLFKILFRKSMTISSFVILPLMVLLAVAAEPTVRLVLGEKWLPCVPFLQIYCFIYALYPIHTLNLSAINALGRSDIFLKLEVVKIFMSVSMLIAFFILFHSAIGIALGSAFASIIGAFINAFPAQKLAGYAYLEQIRDIMPSFLLALLSGAVVLPVLWLDLPDIATIAIQVLVGGGIYLALAKLFKIESLSYVIQKLKMRFGNA